MLVEVFEDSMGHEIIAINDGTYITIEDGVQKFFGEAYRIKDGTIEMICQHGRSINLTIRSFCMRCSR